MDTQEERCFAEQACSFWQLHVPMCDQFHTGLRVRKTASAFFPHRVRVLNWWEGSVNSAYGSLSPLAFCVFIHSVIKNCLHQTVYTQQLPRSITPNERIQEEFF